MSIRTHDATAALAEEIAAALAPTGAVVVTDPEDATGHLLAGTGVVVVAPPRITSVDGSYYTLEWETPVVGAPVGDKATAWRSVDAVLSVLDAHLQITRATPITWTGAQTAQAPAYLITHTRTMIGDE